MIGALRVSIDASAAAPCLGVCGALLAAALIVMSLVSLKESGPENFDLTEQAALNRVSKVVVVVRVTVWSSGLGCVAGLAALVWPQESILWIGLALTLTAVGAFLLMASRTISELTHSGR